jgi:hypothetical protein
MDILYDSNCFLTSGQTTRNNKPCRYYRYGYNGKKYCYEPRNEEEREKAKQKALMQGYAIKSAKYNER